MIKIKTIFLNLLLLTKNNEDNNPNNEITYIVLTLKIEIKNNEANAPIAEPDIL